MALAVVVALVAGGITAFTVLRSSDDNRPVAGQLTNTYPTQPQQGWALSVDDVLPGGIFMWPDSLPAGYGSAQFIELGSTLVTTVGPLRGQQEEIVAADASTGSVKWQADVDGSVTCATASIDSTLPCVIRPRETSTTAQVRFFDLDTGEVRSSIDRSTAWMVEVYDGSVFTLDGGNESNTFNRGTPNDLEARWSTAVPWNTSCPGSGDSHSFEIVDGLVTYTGVGSTVLDTNDGRVLSHPDLGGGTSLPGQGFAGVQCRLPFPTDGYESIVSAPDGSEKFRISGDDPAKPWLVSASSIRPYIGAHGAYDIETGDQIWSVAPDDDFRLNGIIGDIVLGSDMDTVSAYRIDNGEKLWSSVIGESLKFVESDGKRLMASVDNGGLVAIDLSDGSISWGMNADDTHRWSWGKANDGLASITNDTLTYYPPTGGPAGAPGRISTAGANEDEFVTKCGSTPTLTPVEYRTETEGLVVRMEMKASCPSGDIASTNALRVSISDSGSSVASAVFDFSDEPIYLPRTDRESSTNSIEREFLYELDSFWRLPNSLGSSSSLTNATASGTQLVECSDEGTSDTSLTSGSPSQTRTNTPIKPVRAAAPTKDVETTSLDALRAQANADLPFVTNDLADRWVAQISAKRVGLDAADINGAPVHWSAEQILRQHLQLRLTYPEVRLLWSDEWRTFDLRGWWITVAGLTFADADAANGWCDSKQIALDQCYAKIVSNNRESSGTTKYRR
ncbi:outer membrane protein assembly factor BamB family protein [Rhodococcoides yunnanense]|uniref:outer membrane protein assembly factor BamB family protein n=1 Tax=Rhodococcoides yunnanense TaxID=278209 RepID=UPI000B107693|nr:PQQ-binding-like beta-propeller repeat protein [Rhodococcus yunnanensis]